MISSPKCVCLGNAAPGANSTRTWTASRPGALRSCRWRSTRLIPACWAGAASSARPPPTINTASAMIRAFFIWTPFRRLILVDVDDRLREGARRFLRLIVTDAASDQPLRIFAGDFFRVRRALSMRRLVVVAFERESGVVCLVTLRQPFFELVIFRLALGERESPAIVVDGDRDMIGIVERRRAAVERRIVEFPFRRGGLPDELREVARIFLIAFAAPLGGEIILIPPFELGLGRQRRLANLLAADQIAAHGYDRLAALGPEHTGDVGRARAPIETGEDRAVDLERIHECDRVDGERRGLAVAERLIGKKARRAVAAYIRHEHAVSGGREQRRDLDEAVNIIGPAVEQDHHRAVARPRFCVGDI